LLILLFLSLVLQPFLEKDRLATRQKNEKQQLTYIGTTLIPDILSSDLAALEGTLNRLIELHPGWVDATLSNADGRLIYPLEKINTSHQGQSISVDIRHKENLIGTLTVFPDDNQLRREIRQEIRILRVCLGGRLPVKRAFARLDTAAAGDPPDYSALPRR